MLGFIATGFYDRREQDIFTHWETGTTVLTIAHDTLIDCGVPPQAYLTSNPMPDFPPRIDMPCLNVGAGDRRSKEIDALAKYAKQQGTTGQWMIVVRPGQGWINAQRLNHFVQSLDTISGSSAFSLRPLSALEHPNWNTMSTDWKYLAQGVIRQPLRNEQLVQNVSGRFCKGLEGSSRSSISRSQDIDTIHTDDGLLYAIRLQGDQNTEEILSDPALIGCPVLDKTKRPIHERLAIFSVSKHQPLNLKILRNILKGGQSKHS